jgi:hypothetical protein
MPSTPTKNKRLREALLEDLPGAYNGPSSPPNQGQEGGAISILFDDAFSVSVSSAPSEYWAQTIHVPHEYEYSSGHVFDHTQHSIEDTALDRTNNTLPWMSSEPWNPLRMSYGTAPESFFFSETATVNNTTTAWSSSRLPNQPNMSSGPSPTWASSEYFGLYEPGATNSMSTVPSPLRASHLDNLPRRKVDNSAHSASIVSESYSEPPDVLYCRHGGCAHKFTGTHRKGTLHRHLRLKHSTKQDSVEAERRYFCQAEGCGKDFKRQDARLKHYRNKHPELGTAVPKPRKGELG